MGLIDVVRPWHEFFSLVGTASATLIGLLFVAASVGARFYTKEKHPAIRTFLSPSVVHFTCVLAGCLFALAPIERWWVLGVLVAGDGLFGLAYSRGVWRTMVKHGYSQTIDREDRAWYAVVPALGYAGMVGAGVLVVAGRGAGCGVLAGAMGVLLLAGIRNSWDMTVWVVIKSEE